MAAKVLRSAEIITNTGWRGGHGQDFDRFNVTLVRQLGEFWGLSLNGRDREVSDFEYDENTAVGRWNIENPAKAIMVGDVLLSVNKETGEGFEKLFCDTNCLSLNLVFIRMRRVEATGGSPKRRQTIAVNPGVPSEADSPVQKFAHRHTIAPSEAPSSVHRSMSLLSSKSASDVLADKLTGRLDLLEHTPPEAPTAPAH
jgi:hypothetical protein